MAFQKAVWRPGFGLVQEGGGYYTAAGIVQVGDGKPFVRVARGRAVPGCDPETNAPVKQGQKLNLKTRERWEQIKVAVDAAFDLLEGDVDG